MLYIVFEVFVKKEKYDLCGFDVWGVVVVMIIFVFFVFIWEKVVSGQFCYDNFVNGWEWWNSVYEGKVEEEIDDDDYLFVVFFNKIKFVVLCKFFIKMFNFDLMKCFSIVDVYNN